MTKLVRAAALVKLADVSPAIGLDTARMVRRAGLDEACLVTPDMRISENLVATVLEDSAGVAHSDRGLNTNLAGVTVENGNRATQNFMMAFEDFQNALERGSG